MTPRALKLPTSEIIIKSGIAGTLGTALRLHVKFHPYKSGGGGKCFSHAEGGGGGRFEVVLTLF